MQRSFLNLQYLCFCARLGDAPQDKSTFKLEMCFWTANFCARARPPACAQAFACEIRRALNMWSLIETGRIWSLPRDLLFSSLIHVWNSAWLFPVWRKLLRGKKFYIKTWADTSHFSAQLLKLCTISNGVKVPEPISWQYSQNNIQHITVAAQYANQPQIWHFSLTPARTVSCNILCIYWDAIVSEFINKSIAGCIIAQKQPQQQARGAKLSRRACIFFPFPRRWEKLTKTQQQSAGIWKLYASVYHT